MDRSMASRRTGRPAPRTALLVTAFALALGACGGGGAGSTGTGGAGGPGAGGGTFEFTKTPMVGTVDLPTPTGGPFRLSSCLGETNARSGESATLTIYDGGPQMVLVEDEAGNLLLPAMLCTDWPAVNPRAMAVALAFQTLGLHHLDGAVAREAVLELYEAADLDGLERAIADALAAGQSGTTLLGALGPAIDAIVAANPNRRVTSSGIVITPAEERSGVSIVQGDGHEFVVTNYFRRRSKLFLERVGYTDEQGNFTPSPEKLEEVLIAPTSGFNGVVSTILAAVLKGDFAYSPVSFGPFPLVPWGGAKETEYRATVVGIGLQPGDYASLTSDEHRDAWNDMTVRSVLLDFAVPLLINVILPLNESSYRLLVESVETNQAWVDLAKSVFSQAGGVIDQLQAGNWFGAMQTAVSGVWDAGAMRDLFLTTVSAFLQTYKGEAVGNEFLSRAAKFTNALMLVDLLGAAFDAGLQVTNIAQSHQADITTFRVTPPRSKVVAKDKIVVQGQAPPQSLQFVWLDDPPSQTDGQVVIVEYVFEATSGKGRFPNGSPTFVTAFDTVDYVPDADFEGLEVVQVTARDADRNVDLAKANTTFQVMKSKVFITPYLVSLKAGESQTFQGGFAPAFPAVPASYSFRILEGDGSLSKAEGQMHETGDVTYTAASSEGTAQVEITGYRVIDGRWQAVGTDVATIRLEETKSVYQGSWTTEFTTGPGWSQATAYIVVPKVPGTDRYTVRLEDPTGDPAGGWYFPSTLAIDPNGALGNWEDRGDSYRHGLTGGGGPDDWAYTNVQPWIEYRFHDLSVTVEVTYGP